MRTITVAVPVYKVEKWLRRCVDSILRQSAFISEILLIDDGSPDACGEICDEYQIASPLVRVIHQQNRGLAAVRNLAVAKATGEYISFIDSDDYVLDGLYSKAHEILDRYDSDILCFGHQDLYANARISPSEVSAGEASGVHMLSAEEAIDQLFFENNVDVITCNKVIRKSLFDGIAFPEGKLYEDMFTTYKYVSRAHSVACIRTPYYVYCHREDSIGNRSFTEENMNLVRAVDEVYEFGMEFCAYDRNLSVGHLLWLVVVANMMIRSSCEDTVYFDRVARLSRNLSRTVAANGLLSKTRKFELILFGRSLRLYKLFYRSYIGLFR